ncbi:MAG: IclR family transcriptional regulator [Alphaproteobacteria bacterium]
MPPTLRDVPAVTRAVAILRLLGRSDAPMGVNAIARELGLVPSTCLHILRVLAAEELVACDPGTKRYTLASGILALARSALAQHGFARTAQPELDRLARRFGVTAIGVEVFGLEHMVVVAIAHAALGVRLHVDLGSRFPALISATGRCLAAFGGHAWEEIEPRFRRLRWHDAPSFADWRAEMEAVGHAGYALDEGRYIEGVTILCVPLHDGTCQDGTGRMTHGLVAIGVSEQIRRLGPATIAAALGETAVRICGAPTGR